MANSVHSPDTQITVLGTTFPTQEFWVVEFQLTESWSAEILFEEAQKCIGSQLRKNPNFLKNPNSGKKFPAKSVQKSLHV